MPRHLIVSVLASLLIGGLWGCGSPEPAPLNREVPVGKRSVLLLTVDTTRADRLQPYGAQDIATPAMLRLAREGILFERAFAVAPITLVAHTSMLTGLYPFEHGVRNNGIQYVPDDVTTLAEQLKGEGYRTAAFVSAAVLERRYGLDQGFEVYDDDLSAGRDRRPRMVADRPAEAVVAAASRWLDGLGSGESYFLWVHFYDPHAAYSPPAPYRDRYRDRLYDGEIAYMDSQISELLRHPRIEGDPEPIVVLMGDHGESLGEHREQTHAMLAYDSTLHIPFLLKIPDGPEGLRVASQVSQVDLLPTLMELLGLGSGSEQAGKSLVSDIAGLESPVRSLYSETYLPYYTYGWAKLRVLRRGAWKFIDAPAPELYDTANDPRELKDLHGRETERSEELASNLETLLGTVADSEVEAALALDTESEEKLRSLGYLAAGSGKKTVGPRPDPKDVIHLHVQLELARQLMQDRSFDRAESRLRQVLAGDPENLAAWVDLVHALEGQGKIEDAVRAAERVLEIDPDYTRGFVTLARLEAQRGRMEQALALVELAVEKDPRSPEFLLAQARLTIRAGRRDRGAELIKRAARTFPDVPKVAVAHAQMVDIPAGRLGEAEAKVRSALDKDPFFAGGWSVLGRLLEQRRRPVEAMEAYRRGLRSDSTSIDLHGSLGTLLVSTGATAEGIQHLREAVRLSPRLQPAYHVSLGGALADLGQTAGAEREYRRVLEEFPKHPGARNNFAVVLRRQGRMEEAQALLLEVVRDFPGNLDAYNNLSALAVDRRDWSRAESYARKALALDDRLPEAWNNLAVAQEEQGDLKSAEESYEKALAAQEDYWPAYLNLGMLLRKTDRAERAAEVLEQALSRVPNLAAAHYEMGLIYSGRPDGKARAQSHLNAFLKYAAPSDPRRRDARELLGRLFAGAGEAG